ncbi:MAG: DUF4214 domain-containing protein, partial [Sulfitobacter sp.]
LDDTDFVGFEGSFGLPLDITDVNEAPTMALANVSTGVPENSAFGARVKVADVVITDDALGDNVLTVTGTDADKFEIDGTEVFIRSGTQLNFEALQELNVNVVLDDPDFVGEEGNEAIVLPITNVNEAPSVLLSNTTTSLSENANTSNRTKVADITILDDALGQEFLGLTGPDAGLFVIEGTQLFLIAGAVLNFEGNQNLDVTVTVNDPSLGGGINGSSAISIAVQDENDTPQVRLTNVTEALDEGSNTGTAIKVADIIVTDDALGTNALSLSGADANLFEIVGAELLLRAGATLDAGTNPTLDVFVRVSDSTLGSGLNGTAAVSIQVLDTLPQGTSGDDLLIGTPGVDLLAGLEGNDTLVGLASDDRLDGGAGDGDVAVFGAPASNYVIAFENGGITVSDKRSDGTGTDTLIDIEQLVFADDPAGDPDAGQAFNIAQIAGVLDITVEQIETLTEIYLGLFNRAADAEGLFFWATKLAQGESPDVIAQAFLTSQESIDIFGAAPTIPEIVSGAYENMLDREGDPLGEAFWAGLLENNVISVAEFFVLFAGGVEANPDAGADRLTLSNQTDLSVYYAVIQGLSDAQNATSVLEAYDTADPAGSLSAAIDLIDGFAATAVGTDAGGALIIQAIGIIDNPFESV